jgi:hypothetical protein
MSPARLIGFVIGAGICLVALLAWRMPAPEGTLGADVRVIATPPGELMVKPDGVVLAGRAMRPGGEPAEGELEVQNLVGRPLIVRLRGLPSSRALDNDLRLRFRSAGRTIAAGSAGQLRAFSAGPGLRLGPASKARIEATMRLRRGDDRFAGQILDITLELQAKPVGGRR